jgi:hypothetical protein
VAGHEAEVYYHLGLRLSTSEVSGFNLRYLKNLRPGVSYANLGKHVLAAASVNDSDDSDIPQRHTSRELRNILRFTRQFPPTTKPSTSHAKTSPTICMSAGASNCHRISGYGAMAFAPPMQLVTGDGSLQVQRACRSLESRGTQTSYWL